MALFTPTVSVAMLIRYFQIRYAAHIVIATPSTRRAQSSPNENVSLRGYSLNISWSALAIEPNSPPIKKTIRKTLICSPVDRVNSTQRVSNLHFYVAQPDNSVTFAVNVVAAEPRPTVVAIAALDPALAAIFDLNWSAENPRKRLRSAETAFNPMRLE